MKDNVFIKVFEHGKLRETRQGHNVFVARGKAWLSGLISNTAFGPDVPERNDRIRYMGVGIGGVDQGLLSAVNSAPIVTAYPAGFDPNATTGNTYNKDYPIAPSITTLERPVRITGGSNPYASAVAGDRWLVSSVTKFYNTHVLSTEVSFHGRLDGVGGDVVYAPFTVMPLSEVGLFTDEAGVDPLDGTTPYKPLMAYFSFDTIPMTAGTEIELVWSVRF